MFVGSSAHACVLGATWVLLWVSVLGCVAASAEDGDSRRLTLREARERARAASPVLEAAREAVAAARGRERQAGAFPNPSLAYVHEETSRRGETNREDIGLVEQSLEIAGQRGLRREAARLRREAAEARLAAAELALDLDVTRAFARAVAAERKAMHAEQAAEAFARAREISASRHERGDVSGYEVRRTALESARYAARHADAERARRSARALLGSLLSSDPEMAPVPEGPLGDPFGKLPPVEGDLARLKAVALERHPEIRAAELERRAEQTVARLTRREIVPDPTLGLGYKRERTAGESGRWEGFAAQVTVPVPLWDRRGGAVEAAVAEARGAAARVRKARRRVVLEVERAFHELRAVSRQLEAIGPQLGAEADAALRAVRTAYREGEISLVEWLDAVRAYTEAEAIHADLLADHRIRRAVLERAVGGSLL